MCNVIYAGVLWAALLLLLWALSLLYRGGEWLCNALRRGRRQRAHRRRMRAPAYRAHLREQLMKERKDDMDFVKEETL